MRKILFGGLVVSLALAIGLMLLGVYINYRGESQISKRMADRALLLRGEVVSQREIYPRMELPVITIHADNMTDVIALVDGQIANLMVEKNSKVTAGQPICTVVNEEVALKLQEIDSNLLEAEAKLKNAVINYNRYRRLWEKEAASAEKYDAATTAYEAAQARIETMQAQRRQILLQESRQTVYAPVDGVVQLLYCSEHAFVKAGTPVALISAKKDLVFYVNANDEFASICPPGSMVRFIAQKGSAPLKNAGKGAELSDNEALATVYSITPDFSVPADKRRMEMHIDVEDYPQTSTYTDAILQSNVPHKCLAAPLTAFLDAGTFSEVYVFVPQEAGSSEGIIQRRKVKVGVKDEQYVEILSGVGQDEIVIVSGKHGLEDGMTVNVEMGGE